MKLFFLTSLAVGIALTNVIAGLTEEEEAKLDAAPPVLVREVLSEKDSQLLKAHMEVIQLFIEQEGNGINRSLTGPFVQGVQRPFADRSMSLRGVELMGLEQHAEPVVYVRKDYIFTRLKISPDRAPNASPDSENPIDVLLRESTAAMDALPISSEPHFINRIPVKTDLDNAKTRSLTDPELQALQQLDAGAPLSKLDNHRFMAPIHAASDCTRCHEVEVGTMLGAFIYEFEDEAD